MDDALQHIVAEMTAVGLPLSVTIFVGGTLVTGDLVSAPRFFELSAELMGRWADEAIGERADANVRSYFARYVRATTNEEGAFTESTLPTMLHLEGAQLLVDGQLVPEGGMAFRYRIDEVSGFSIGRIQPRA